MSEIKDELARRASNIKSRDVGERMGAGSIGERMGTGSIGEKMEAGNVGYEADRQKMTVRLLRADEIECRVATINEKGLSLLLFKDARVDQKILDETFTPFGWRRTHQCIDGNLYCTVEIWDQEKQQWIAKQDVGTTSYSEKEKGQASDSFKRACFNWGIGRALYTAPFIWVPAEKVAIQKKGERYVTSDRFSVQSIAYNAEREIAALVIVNGKGYQVYEMWQKVNPKQEISARQDEKQTANPKQEIPVKQEEKQTANPKQEMPVEQKENQGVMDMQMLVLYKELERTGIPLETVLARYQLQNLEQMTEDIYTKALSGLKRTKTKQAA